MARDVYDHCPTAWWLTIPAERVDFGEELSPVARTGFDTALRKIRALASQG
jgi:Ni,Fe-hydrogenase maturation factor